MLQSIVGPIKEWAEGFIGSNGYLALSVLMLLSSANVPIPSEVILPFGGILAGEGKLNLHLVAGCGVLGTLLGSVLTYAVCARGGKEFLLKYGKYVLLRPAEIEHAEAWYVKHGELSTLWGRFIPVVRSFISLPAGIFRANFGRFVLYALIAAIPWSYAWTLLGFYLGKNWATVEANLHYVDYVVFAAVAFFLAKFIRYRMRSQAS